MAATGLLGCVLVLAGIASGAPVSVTVPVAADTYVRSGAPDTNEGGSVFLRVRASGDNRALVRFDQQALQTAVGSGSLVSASLELDIVVNGDNWGASGRTVSVFRLTSDWAEGNGFVDQGSPPDRGTGSGATWACAVDANIANQARDCSGATVWEMGKPNQPQLHPWLEPASATVLITNGLTGTVSFDVTADVQAFLAGAAQNNGWIVKKDLEGPSGLVQFASRETGNGPRLRLVVDSAADAVDPFALATSLADPLPPAEDYTNGQGLLSVEVYGEDDASGVRRVSVYRGLSQLAVSEASCGSGCPASYSATLSFDVSSFPEGNVTLEARAEDDAGNIGASEPWTLRVDRTAPGEATNIRIARFDGAGGTATVAWEPGADPQLADGSPGTGVRSYAFRFRVGTGSWSALEITSVPEFEVAATLGEIVDVEVRSVDAAGNASAGVAATLTVFQAAEELPWYLTPTPNQVALSAAQETLAIETAQNDPRVGSLIAGQQVSVGRVLPWSIDGTQATLFGADLTLVWNSPIDLESDWPVVNWDLSNTTYETGVVRYRMVGATELTVQVTFDPLEVVALEPYGGDVDQDSIEVLSSAGGFNTLAAIPANPEGLRSQRNNPNVYLISRARVPAVGEDAFWSWDFGSSNFEMTAQSVKERSDWPVAMIFTNDATVDLAKRYYAGRALTTRAWGSTFDRGPHPQGHAVPNMPWDRDEGTYKGPPCYGDKYHYRVYGGNPDFDGDDRMFNIAWGFYVVATAHIDHNEDRGGFPLGLSQLVCWNTSFGDTDRAMETIEQDISDYIATHLLHDAVRPNRFELFNGAADRQGNRILQNDGLATEVCVADSEGIGCISD